MNVLSNAWMVETQYGKLCGLLFVYVCIQYNTDVCSDGSPQHEHLHDQRGGNQASSVVCLTLQALLSAKTFAHLDYKRMLFENSFFRSTAVYKVCPSSVLTEAEIDPCILDLAPGTTCSQR
jgi:hypothetical protein